MEKAYHQIIPRLVFAQMPTAFQEFFEAQGYTPEMRDFDAVKPDAVYHDSMADGPEGHWMHSYKQEVVNGHLRYCRKPAGGECLERVKACAINAKNWRTGAESYMMCCRELVIASHYVVDIHTYPHLVLGKPWSTHHLAFEMHEARWLSDNKEKIGDIPFVIYPDIYKAFVTDARMTAIKVVNNLEKGIPMTDDENVALARLIASSVKSYWMTVTKNFWPKE